MIQRLNGSDTLVVTFAKGLPRYIESAKRQGDNLLKHNPEIDWICYHDESELPGCPTHQENPYAFKAFALMKAYQDGYEHVIWMDSVVNVIKSIEPLLAELLMSTPFISFNNIGYKVKDYCNDSCEEKMFATDNEMEAPMIMACVMAFDMLDLMAVDLMHQYYDYCLEGAFIGSWDDHRHDQTVASILRERYRFPLYTGHETFFMYKQHIDKEVTVDGETFTMHKANSVCLLSE